jgi:flagellar basal body-associated protein FliL
MSDSQHIPIHPRFPKSGFIPFANSVPQPAPAAQPPVNENIDDFDLFEVPPQNIHSHPPPKDDDKPKQKYNTMIIIMVVVIVVLIIIVVWLMLSSNDEPVPEKIMQPQYMRPPGFNMPPQMMQQPQGMQQQPQMMQQPQGMQQQPQMMQQPQGMQQQPQMMQQQSTKEEVDRVFQELKQMNAKQEKLPNLESIIEETEEEDDN